MNNSVTSFATTDLCDAHEARVHGGEIQVLEPRLLSYGGRAAFCGPCVTLKLFEDNSLLAQIVKEPGQGRVLVVDAGGSLRRAVLGGNLTSAAADNGWSGIMINGAVRDMAEIESIDIGVLALGLNPSRSIKRNTGERDVSVAFLGARFVPGAWVYADRDGVLVAPTALT